MKILVYTDPHIDAHQGNIHFLDMMSFYFKNELIERCQRDNITTCICAGDFFNSRQSVSLKALDYVNNEFIPMFENAGIHTYMIAGNHDVAFKNTNKINSLSVFKRSEWFTIVDDKVASFDFDGVPFVLVPWINAENNDDIMTDIDRYRNEDAYLVGHFEIAGMKMYKNSGVCDHGMSPDSLEGYKKVLSGHFHHASNYSNIEYLGSLFHLSWSCAGDWRGYRIFDTETGEWELVENPYSLYSVVSSQTFGGLSNDEIKALCADQYVKLVIDGNESRVAVETLKHEIEKYNPIRLDIIDLSIFTVTGENIDNVEKPRVSDENLSLAPIDQFKKNFVDIANLDDPESVLEVFSSYVELAEARLKEYGDI